MNKIDTCGTSCPQPVLMTKKALESNPAEIEVLVDNNTAKTNVKKFLSSKGYSIVIEENTEDIFTIKAEK
nr:sulfurtransferase TusA family protein [Sedimentibacter sp.]